MTPKTKLLLLAAAAAANVFTPAGIDLAVTAAICLLLLPVARQMDREEQDRQRQ